MGLLARIAGGTARAGARAAGRALSRHVVPDSLIPSWKTKKTVSSGFSLLSKAARSIRKPKKKKPSSPSSAKRPGPAKPKQKFDKNAYLQGRSLVSADFSKKPPQSRLNSFLGSSIAKQVSNSLSRVKGLLPKSRYSSKRPTAAPRDEFYNPELDKAGAAAAKAYIDELRKQSTKSKPKADPFQAKTREEYERRMSAYGPQSPLDYINY